MRWRARWRGSQRRKVMVLIASPLVALALAAGVPAANAAVQTHATVARTPVEPCSSLTGMSLPGLPGSDTATVTATEVAGSGCQVGVEITDTSDPRGGQPGNIGIDVTLPDIWNGNYMAEGNGVYCSPASFVTVASDQWLAAGYAISQDDCGHTGSTDALISPWVTYSGPSTSAPLLDLNWNRIDDFGYLAQHLMAVERRPDASQQLRLPA